MPSMENSRKRPFLQRENRAECSGSALRSPASCQAAVPLPCCTQSLAPSVLLPHLLLFSEAKSSLFRALGSLEVLEGAGLDGGWEWSVYCISGSSPSLSKARHSLFFPAPSTYFLVLSCS